MTPRLIEVPALEMNILWPLITHPPSRGSARVRMHLRRCPLALGQPECAERLALRQRPQPPLALLIVTEYEDRQAADRGVRLPRSGDGLISLADVLHGRHEPDGRGTATAPFFRDEQPEQPCVAHSLQNFHRATLGGPGGRRGRGYLAPGQGRREIGEGRLVAGQVEIHNSIVYRPVKQINPARPVTVRRRRLGLWRWRGTATWALVSGG